MLSKTTFLLVFVLFVGVHVGWAEDTPAPGDPAPPDTLQAAATDTTDLPYMGMVDVVVVTASRTEQRVADAPAALTVFNEQHIQDLPASYYTDYMRIASGVNALEFSAGDQSVNPRSAAGTLPLGLLILV